MALRMEFMTTCRPRGRTVTARLLIAEKMYLLVTKNDVMLLSLYFILFLFVFGFVALEARFSLGTPETRRKGLSTLKALRAFMSKPPPFSVGTPAILLMVSRANVKRLWEQIFRTVRDTKS